MIILYSDHLWPRERQEPLLAPSFSLIRRLLRLNFRFTHNGIGTNKLQKAKVGVAILAILTPSSALWIKVTIYVERNIEARSCYRCCRRKTISIHILCVLSSRQSACAVLYCYLWPLWLYHLFLQYLNNSMIFGRTLLNIKCVFWFSLQPYLKHFSF